MSAGRKPMTFDVDRSPLTPIEQVPPTPAVEAAAPRMPAEDRQQVGARVTKLIYRQLKAQAALQGVTVQALVEQVIAEYLANHRRAGGWLPVPPNDRG
jgi:hypothetical protein